MILVNAKAKEQNLWKNGFKGDRNRKFKSMDRCTLV